MEGAIKLSDVQMRYREGLPLVLKGITLDIKAQEKIGIVGRTGSGMLPSLPVTILRCKLDVVSFKGPSNLIVKWSYFRQ